MNRIVAPLNPRDEGADVVNLQTGLRRLLITQIIEVDSGQRDELLRDLARESQERVYSNATTYAVRLFQEQHRLDRTGMVDEVTAESLNSILQDIGGFDDGGNSGWFEVLNALNQQTETLRAINQGTSHLRNIEGKLTLQRQRPYVVSGVVRGDDNLPVVGVQVRAFHEDGHARVRLGQDSADAEGHYTIHYELLPEVDTIHLRVAVFDADGRTLATSALIEGPRPVETVDLFTPVTGPGVSMRTIVGRVTLEDGHPAENILLQLIRHEFGGRTTVLDQTQTLIGGRYALSFTLEPAAASLQIVALRPSGEAVPLEGQLNYLGREQRITRDLIAPVDLIPRPVEFWRMADDLRPYIGEISALADAKETANRQDLTVLNRATRWDARLLAQGALAARLSADAETPTSVEAFYGLLRAGLPADKTLLAQVDPEVAAAALTAVRDAGIIGLADEQINTFKHEFTEFSVSMRLSLPVPGGNSSYAQMLSATGLSQTARETFAGVFAKHGADATKLWTEAARAGLSDQEVDRLQLQGKLAFLTGSSQEMTTHLMQMQVAAGPAGGAAQLTDPAQLADLGLYTAEAWDTKLVEATAAMGQSVDKLIPSTFVGAPAQRRKMFNEEMARKVRISYPMQVLAHEIRTDGEDAFRLGEAGAPVANVLRSAAAQGFRLGQTPIDAFFDTHPGVAEGLTDGELQSTKAALKDLQRTYQISPNDTVMKVMRSHGLYSAHDVTSLRKEYFSDYYGYIFPSKQVAELVYRKAEQVSSVVYNLFTIANQIESQVVVYGASAPADVRQSVKNELIKHYPTLETLFGSMDFCECEYCRSVLSPAAYLADLLQYVEGEDAARAGFEARWQDQHKGEKYTSRYALPYDALIERRPDLPHIPLTCENTHTALPYIDIVNEILEYYVANGALAPAAARDTGEATSAELLAEPQHVIRAAYEAVRMARYPLTLPFDLWLETVRQFCNFGETPLADLLETFRSGDELLAPTQPYDRAAIFIESLGLSPDEAALFTDPDPLTDGKWYRLFGYAITGPVIAAPTNAAPDATLTLPNKTPLAVGDRVTYYDAGANGVQGETMTIKAFGADDSGGPGQTLVTLTGVWVTPPVAGNQLIAAAPALLASAKTLSRRLGVTYKELVEIVKSGFVNPKLVELSLLYKVGATVPDLLFYRDYRPFYEANKDLLGKDRKDLSAANQARYDKLAEKDPTTGLTGWEKLDRVHALLLRLAAANVEFAPFDAVAWVETALANNELADVLVLADPNTGCDFDATMLRYADGRGAADIDFLRINLFVRLWRKLGWTIEETDHALSTFTQNTPFTVANLNQQPLRVALIYLSHLKHLEEKVRVGKGSRLKLLTLWSDLATTGKKPLYAQLFLTRSDLKSGEVEIVLDNGESRHISIFGSALGLYLDPTELAKIADLVRHRVSLRDVKAADKLDAAHFAGVPAVGVEYDPLGEVQTLTYRGILTDTVKGQLLLLSNSPKLPALLDAVQAKAKEFTLIAGHLPALQGALGLTADEIGRILTDGGLNSATAGLTLPNLSLLYCYGLLAKALKLSVSDLITLKALSGLNPFKALSATPPTTLAADHPYSQTLRFVEIVEEIKASGLSIEDLDYLLRHRTDPTGKYRPKTDETMALLKSLAEGIRAIRAEHALPADLSTLTDEALQQKLALLLPPDIVQRFLAMVNGTVDFTATLTGVTAAGALDPAAFAAAPTIVAVSPHNVARGEQKLTYRGVLFASEQATLEAQFNGLPQEQKTTLSALLTAVRQQARDFFDNQLKKQPLRRADDTGYLAEGDFATLFKPLKPLKQIEPTDTAQEVEAKLSENQAIAEENRQELQKRRARIAVAFMPLLQARLVRQFVVQTLTAQTGADMALVESLLTDERLLGLPAGATVRPLLAALTAATRGVDATFYNNENLTGTMQPATPIVASADTALKDKKDKNGNVLGPAGSARFEGYLEVPSAGAYRFYLILDKKEAAFKLSFDHLAEPLFLKGMADEPGTVFGEGANEFLELKPGLLYHFTLEVTKLNSGEARLLVQGETLPKGPLVQLTLYPASTIHEAEEALLLLNKALQLLQALGLSERETRYLLTHTADFADINFSELPTAPTGETEAEKAATVKRFEAFLRLAAYIRLKRDLAAGTDDLIAIFEANGTTGADRLDALVYPRIAQLTRRDVLVVKSVANTLFAVPTFANEQPLLRLWAALQVVDRFGVPVASLRSWTGIVNAAATPAARFAIARDVRESIKARFEPETWQAVARPIFDRLRRQQRDALVAHILHTRGFERLEQLYEYFLIDPGMEPVVQTSRIRLAIASVQLFIQRCLLNLEPKVHPSAILNANHWEWMKRYRVWEANRKIFLFPENWLEPEFRDNKSHLFTELEGALLQGDVSRDLAEDAFLNYLRKLNELARLDIVAMHLEQKDDPGQNVLHVFGRTYSGPHKYFYRRFAAGMWSPWEPVTTEIQGDHLAPVIWRDRLYLFWVTFIEKAEQSTASVVVDYKTPQTIPAAPPTYLEAQLHWSEYLNGEWSTHESGGPAASTVIKLPGMTLAKSQEILVHVSKEYVGVEERGVFVHLNLVITISAPAGTPMSASATMVSTAFYLAGRNSSPVKTAGQPVPANPYPSANQRRANRYGGSGPLKVHFTQRITTESGKPPVKGAQDVLAAVNREYTILPLNHPMRLGVPEEAYKDADKPDEVKKALENSLAETESLIKPVFFQDDTHTFFVEPDVVERAIEEWQTWLEPTQPPGHYEEPWIPWRKGQFEAYVPKHVPEPWPPEDPLFGLGKLDWLVNPATVIRFDDQTVGPLGRLPLTFEQGIPETKQVGVPVHVNASSAVNAVEVTVLQGGLGLEDVGLIQASGGLNVIGMGGANAGIMQNVEHFGKNDVGAGIAGVMGR